MRGDGKGDESKFYTYNIIAVGAFVYTSVLQHCIPGQNFVIVVGSPLLYSIATSSLLLYVYTLLALIF